MNKERILHIADVVEAQPHKAWHADDGFNMLGYFHTCGTPSCIAGFCIAERDGTEKLDKSVDFLVEGADYLGLDLETADNLFMPAPISEYESITPDHAARVLRRLAETGKVNWHVD